MYTIMLLLTAHLIGDYALQQAGFFALKHSSLIVLMLHTTIWAISVSIALKLLGRFRLWKFWFSLIVHTMIDYFKPILFPYPPPISVMLIDQLLHVLQITLVSLRRKISIL